MAEAPPFLSGRTDFHVTLEPPVIRPVSFLPRVVTPRCPRRPPWSAGRLCPPHPGLTVPDVRPSRQVLRVHTGRRGVGTVRLQRAGQRKTEQPPGLASLGTGQQQSSGGFSDSPERPGHPALSPPVVGAAVAWHASRPPAPGSPASGAPACTQAGRQSRGAWGRGSHAARARPRPAEFAHVTQPSPASTSRLSEAGGTAPPSQGQARCPREQCNGCTSHTGAPCVAVSLGPTSASRTAQLPAPRSLGPGLVPTGRSKPGTAVTSGSGFALSSLGVLENHRSQERGGVRAFERLRIPARQTDAAHEVAVSADNAQSARPSRLHGAGRRL